MSAPEVPQYPPEYLAGVRFFNEREFFESHEILEDIWNACPLESRSFYQGLIQAAVALHHFSNGNVWGARKLYWSSRKYLEPYQPYYLGLDVSRFLADMNTCFEDLLASDEADAAVEIDAERIPTIVLAPPPAQENASGFPSSRDSE
jgi:hypothetical protein